MRQALLGTPSVPYNVHSLSCRAQRRECVRLRCLQRDCPFREQLEIAALGDPKKTDDEISTDDKEAPGADEGVQEDEGEQDPGVPEVPAGLALDPAGTRDFVRDRWPFAMPHAYYKDLVTALTASETLDNIVCLTTAAHPGMLFAAFALHLEACAFVYRDNPHAMKHGYSILRDALYADFIKIERSKQDGRNKRVRTEELQWIQIAAPEEQAMHSPRFRRAAVPQRGGRKSTATRCQTLWKRRSSASSRMSSASGD